MSAKEDLMQFCAQAWPGLTLSGRSDLHCYFWPAATRFLVEGGWFGFLVSSSWLDVEYGFALQEWVLSNFRIHAIFESNAEPWFEDARVKTCAVILQRCADSALRQAQLVRFVRLDAPLNTILGDRADDNARQDAAEKFRAAVLACKRNATREGWRVVLKQQKDLWEDGLRAGRLFEMQRQRDLADNVKAEAGADDDENGGPEFDENGNGKLHEISATGYGGGKWGNTLRAPNFYFRVMERYGSRFVPLGEIATIRFGVKSGCDAFFMPRDVSAKFLEDYSKLDWNEAPLINHCKRAEVESGNRKTNSSWRRHSASGGSTISCPGNSQLDESEPPCNFSKGKKKKKKKKKKNSETFAVWRAPFVSPEKRARLLPCPQTGHVCQPQSVV